LSLDKWLAPEKKPPKKKPEVKKPADKKPPKKKPEKKKESEVAQEDIQPSKIKEEKKPLKVPKFSLSCPKKGCNYQKIKVKKELSERDKICPRCKGQMNVKQI
jgi:hypothetical protein